MFKKEQQKQTPLKINLEHFKIGRVNIAHSS